MKLGVTGISGTVGLALGDRLERDRKVDEVVGISSHPFDPVQRGWSKVRHRTIDVRDLAGLCEALEGCDVVVNLAFALPGVTDDLDALEAINVGGTRNVWSAASAVGARRFVQASSAAVYGIRELPQPITEDTPVRGDDEHFYTAHKARAELLLREAAKAPGAPELTVLRPCGIAGPHASTVIARAWPAPLRTLATFAYGAGLRPPLPAPPVPMQFLHETDAAAAFHRAAVHGPAGVFNIAPEDSLEGEDVLRELGFTPIPAPASARLAGLRALLALPVPIPAWSWLHLVRVPYLLDIAAAKRDLRWRPKISSADALAATRAAWSA
jgi:nucleoside-diphosphate-sugar epimerase